MSAFSRLQLAAALIEYDNDPTDPDKPFYSAQESAIFAPARNARTGPYPPRRNSNYLGVNLPSEGGSQSPRATQVDGQHGRAPSSLSGLMTNPFGKGADDELEGGEGEEAAPAAEELEVDLASWGLDSFIPKEKEKGRKKKGKGKAREVELPNPHDGPSRPASRAASVDLNTLGAGGAFLDSASTAPPPMAPRRRSASSAMELGAVPLDHSALPPRAHSLYLDSLSAAPEPPLHSVPFPSQSVRSASPGPSVNLGAARGHGRAHSTASWNSKLMLEHIEERDPNPFELQPPSPSRTSRFDPKGARSRTASIGSMGSRALLNEAEADTFSIRPPSPSRSSRFDPKTRSRVMSTASLGSRMMLDDNMSVMTGARSQHPDRPVSTMELLRPKVLVMPSPLQGAPQKGPPSSFTVRDGFELRVAQDGTPLPPAARATPHGTLSASASAPAIASNSFTPNPRANLSLSQLIFRNQLMVDGQRDVAYTDIDQGLERATEDGQQIFLPPDEEEPARPVSVVVDEFARPAGKLYGRSLIDELETRKATTRAKQRVFYGDDRPSMMARASSGRISTLIDPATLNQPPTLAGVPSPKPDLQRRSSYGLKPLLDLDDSAPLAPPVRPGLSMTRSVFGTDKLWEKEMAKLKQIEAVEAAERAEREAREAADAERKQKKKKKKGKGKEDESLTPAPSADSFAASGEAEAEPRVSIAPPILPDIPRNITRGPPPPPGDDDDDDTEESDSDTDPGRQPSKAVPQTWFAGSSDDGHEANGPVRTVGVGLRYPNRARGARPSAGGTADDDDSEEDMPLVATVSRAIQRATRLAGADDDSDEDAPLTQVLAKKTGSVPAPVPSSSLNIDFDNLASSKPAANIDSDDEDDQPLGLRASRVPRGSDDEDDLPLGMHPDQQRRTQYAALVQQQQAAQQQQMLMQQMHMQQSMMFSNPSLMGSGFFSPPAMMTPAMNPMNPMGMMMPMVPPQSGSPPPVQDSNKFNLVDQWRKNIAVDSQS